MNDELLIELVRSNPVLYDLSHSRYMDTNYKMYIWNKIGETMKAEAFLCKARWANIRDNYKKSLKRTATKTGPDSKRKKVYKYSEQLSFILKHFDDRPQRLGVDKQLVKEDSQDYTPQQYEDEDDTISRDGAETTVSDHEDKQIHPSGILKAGYHFEVPEKLRKGISETRKEVVPQTAAAKLMEYLITKNENQTAANTTSQHPIDAFLAGISPTLKSLTPYYLNLAKSEIFATVQKYEMQMLMEQKSQEERPDSNSYNTNTPAEQLSSSASVSTVLLSTASPSTSPSEDFKPIYFQH